MERGLIVDRLRCPVCGDWFYPVNTAQKYCSYDCRRIKMLDQRRTYKEKAKDKPPAVKSNGPKIDAYALEAKLRHVSYGKLQVERTLRKIREG